MGFLRAFGWYCSSDPVQIGAAVTVPGTTAVAAGPAIFQASGDSTDPGAGYSYLSKAGRVETVPAFDPSDSILSLRQIRAAGKTAVLKMLFYAQDGTAVTDIDPGSEAAAAQWCENYYTTVLAPFLSSALPLGAEFDVLNLETELNQVTGPYPAAWRALIQEIRSSGFTGIITSSANDPTVSTTPWAGDLDWFGYDFYPQLTNSAYLSRHPESGNVSEPGTLGEFFAAAMPLQEISNAFGGIPVYLGEFGFGYGPDGAGASQVAWSDEELTTMTGALFEALSPLACWAGMTMFNWPYDHPDGTAVYPRRALLEGLSAGWSTYRMAPDPAPRGQPGPGSGRGRGPSNRTVVPHRR